MIAPKRAPVRPRVLSSDSGTAVLLEDAVQGIVAAGGRGSIQIVGSPGAGKTTALEHLAHVFADWPNLRFLDWTTTKPIPEPAGDGWVVFAIAGPSENDRPIVRLQLAPWGRDEWIEYLLAGHRAQCGSVMARLRDEASCRLLTGNPELWRIVLDLMAGAASIATPRQALAKHLDARLPDSQAKTVAAAYSLAVLVVVPRRSLAEIDAEFRKRKGGDAVVPLLRHRALQILAAVGQIRADLQNKSSADYFRFRFPRELVLEVGNVVTAGERAKLQSWFQKPELQANVGSILRAAVPGWRPECGTRLRLVGAYLDHVAWSGLDLTETDFSGADLSGANLSGSTLAHARADKANLAHANLSSALLANFSGVAADFTQAELSKVRAPKAVFDGAGFRSATLQDADLRQATFVGADLSSANVAAADLRQATLTEAKLAEADFTGANLESAILSGLKLHEATFTGASWAGARLVGCDLEGMELPGANFAKANLGKALLTGSSMPDACFDGACLEEAGLAEIEWERASLRGAKLRGASFHLGSSRSGRVGSPIASEGSQTGFYTDDFTEQEFKAPEEIRKANLCYADLRGAVIDDVDFYLVDLRHALFDPQQEAHLRRCGAILEDRGPE